MHDEQQGEGEETLMMPTLYLEEAQEHVAKWHKKCFPALYNGDTEKLFDQLFLKLSEETGEAVRDYNHKEKQGKLAHETMDVIVVALQIIEVLGQSSEMKFDEVMEKNQAKLKDD